MREEQEVVPQPHQTKQGDRTAPALGAIETESRQGKLRRRSAKAGGRTRPPIDRGGRPRGTQFAGSESRVDKPLPRAELICWKAADRSWHIGLELPPHAEPTEGPRQDEEPLTEDDEEEGLYPLAHLSGTVGLDSPEIKLYRFELPNEGPLAFKLGSWAKERGRFVQQLTAGPHVVVAPDNVARDELRGGKEFVKPEPVSVKGYLAHFFELDSQTTIAFEGTTGSPFEASSVQVKLVGIEIADAGQDQGPLFGREPPSIQLSRHEDRGEISEIVLVEEGIGRGGWRKSYTPESSGLDISLPPELLAELLERKVGWYGARVYSADNLITSIDFRFAGGIHSLTIDDAPVFPGKDGHDDTKARFEIEGEAFIDFPNAQVVTHDGSVEVLITSSPEHDQLDGQIQEGGRTVPLRLAVPRVWWARADESDEPERWESLPLEIEGAEVSPASKEAIWVRLPAGWEVACWWQTTGNRRRLNLEGRIGVIPLRDIADSLPGKIGRYALTISIESPSGEEHSGQLITLIRRGRCTTCSEKFSDKTDLEAHINKHEYEDRFNELRLDERRERFQDLNLPVRVYRCGHCKYLARSEGTYIQEDVVQHIKHECATVKDEFNHKIKFEVIQDPAVIRSELIAELARILRCKSCRDEFQEPTKDQLKSHFLSQHLEETFEVE